MDWNGTLKSRERRAAATRDRQKMDSPQVLLEELRSDDSQARLNAIRRLAVVADALGPDRTRNELVPYLTASLDAEDELLAALADELGA